MAIPSWIIKTASDEKGASVKLTDDTYKKLLDMYKGGKLDEWASQVMEEVECLLDVVNTAISQVNQKLEGKPAMTKSAAPEAPAKEKGKSKEDAPFDFGDDRLKEEMTPAKEEKDEKGNLLPPARKLPPKMKEPETTKWKEIRFNKRTGTWQVVVTIRHTRNFLSEDEAVDFTKKASKE